APAAPSPAPSPWPGLPESALPPSRSPPATTPLGVGLERLQLLPPEAFHLVQPPAQSSERCPLQTVDPRPRIVLQPIGGHQPRLAEDAQVPAHRRPGGGHRLGDLARPARLGP